MQRRSFLKSVGIASSAGIAGLAGCGGSNQATATPLPDNTVGMYTKDEDFYFSPIGLHVEPGTTVTWRLESGRHSTTAFHEGYLSASSTRIPKEGDFWDSGTLSSEGKEFEHTFEVEGTYDYYCMEHKVTGMVGRIVVGEPGGPAEETEVRFGSLPDSSNIVDQGSISYSEFSE